MIRKALRASALTIASLATASVGFTGLASASSADISLTGPHSYNQILYSSGYRQTVTNNNSVDVSNNNNQTARSGNVNVSGNTVVGDVYSGNASNYNNTTTNVSIANSLPGMYFGGSGSGGFGNASIYLTGPGSYNVIRQSNNDNDYYVRNNNRVNVANYNTQHAYSGDVDVAGNTGNNCGCETQNDWENWSPRNWQSSYRDFDDWWIGVNSHLSTYRDMYAQCNQQHNYNQDDWSYMNPGNWCQRDHNYNDWYATCRGYLHDNYNTWKSNWHGHGGNTVVGNVYSGDARNDNTVHNAVYIHNDSMPMEHHNYGGTSQASIYLTGPDSTNTITYRNNSDYRVTNNNDVNVNNTNNQTARSGNVNVSGNTVVGDVYSGNASNTNHTSTTVDVANSAPIPVSTAHSSSGGMYSIDTTGPDSTNKILTTTSSSYRVTNNNDVNVSNTNNQTAVSGDVNVSHNTVVGNVSSGDAMNTNSTSTSVSIQN